MKNILISIGMVFFMITASFAADEDFEEKTDDSGFDYHEQNYVAGSKSVFMFSTDSGFGKVKNLGIAKEFADENIEALTKFLKWAAIAKEHGDVLNKEIAIVQSIDGGSTDYWNQYKIVSSNGSQSLAIIPGKKIFLTPFTPNQEGLSSFALFNVTQVKHLLKRLQELKDGKLFSATESNYK